MTISPVSLVIIRFFSNFAAMNNGKQNNELEGDGLLIRPLQPSMKRRAQFHDYSVRGVYMLTLVVEGRRGLPGGLELGDGAAEHGTLNRGRGLGKASLRAGLFERGYNDRLLFDGEQLERWKHYLDDNPRRLAVKRLHPDLFVVRRGMRIAGRDCQIVGNQFLLDIPDKVAVIVHRVDSDEVFARKKAEWLACGERGGVIVSAAIAKREKEVMREAMERGYCLILLRENGFSEFYKPVGEAFDACARGQLLQVSPWAFHTASSTISRVQCLELNCLAEDIVAGVGEKSNGCNSE